MSRETYEWLNNFCLIGYTDKRGTAWHFKASEQGVEPNHYAGPIPVEDVIRRLFNWKPVKLPFKYTYKGRKVEVPGRQIVVASDNGDFLNVSSDGYQPHEYGEWLINNVANLLDDELGIASALLLRRRGVAAVTVEVPESFVTPDGVKFRPNLVATTSLDKSSSTIYKRTHVLPVCDNTLDWSLREEGQEFRVAHTRNSLLRLGEARDALQIIFESAGAFEAQVGELCATQVTDKQWQKVLDALAPIPTEDGRSKTVAEKKRGQLVMLWSSDERVEPWKNSAWGVLQAFNTWDHHFKTVRNVHRAERNFDLVLSGVQGQADLKVVDVLGAILGKELLAA